jgi:hypothetical protein
VCNYYKYKGVDEITGQVGNFVHPESMIKSGSRCCKGPKRPFQHVEPEFRQILIIKKNNTSPSGIFEKKIISKADEITSFDGNGPIARYFEE